MNNNNLLSGQEPLDIKQLILEPNLNTRKYNGFYRGIVIQNNDPERRGRVKVFIPSLQAQVYNQWLDSLNIDKSVRFPAGTNLYKDCSTGGSFGSIAPIIEQLKDILPWGEQASSLVGSGSSGLYNATSQKSTISQASDYASREPVGDACSAVPNTGSLNVDNIGEKAGYKYEVEDYLLNDGFVSVSNDKMPNINPFAYLFKPSTYSNCTAGLFAIPDVGAHVWCFFDGGDLLHPVYFAFSYDSSDWQKIHEQRINPDYQNPGINYPGAFENKANADQIKRGKLVLNSKGASIEVIDTDNFESIKISQSSGSFIQFNKHANTELSVGNSQKLTLGDSFNTVNGSDNIHVKSGRNIGVDGSTWTRSGTWNVKAYQRWAALNSTVADNRALFPIQRTSAYVGSSKQKQSGRPAPNPILQTPIAEIETTGLPSNIYNEIPVSSTQRGNQVTKGETLRDVVRDNSSKINRTTVTSEEYYRAAGPQGSSSAAGNPSISPSSKDGRWASDPNYTSIGKQEEALAEQLLDIEREMGDGGDDVEEVTRHKVVVVGAAFNDTPSVRVDPVGHLSFNEVLLSESGAFPSQKPSPLVERVANGGKFPCGNLSMTVGNMMNINVGTGGISQSTVGCFDIVGKQVVIAGSEEVLVSSTGDVVISSNSRAHLEGDIVTLRQRDGGMVGVDGGLGVRTNLIVAGGGYFGGELYVNHITGPAEVQETEAVKVYGKTVANKIIGRVFIDNNWHNVFGGLNAAGLPADSDSIELVEHTHNFLSLPMSLKKDNRNVRLAALDGINKRGVPVTALPISNTKKVAS